MLKNIFATIGVIFTAVKGYEMYEQYKDAMNENKVFKQGGCCYYPHTDIDIGKAED